MAAETVMSGKLEGVGMEREKSDGMGKMELRTGKGWFARSIAVSLIGGAMILVLAVWWFLAVDGHCGVVRFYEQLCGAVLLFCWSAGSGMGLLVAHFGQRRQRTAVLLVGFITTVLVNIAAVVLFALLVHGLAPSASPVEDTGAPLGMTGTRPCHRPHPLLIEEAWNRSSGDRRRKGRA